MEGEFLSTGYYISIMLLPPVLFKHLAIIVPASIKNRDKIELAQPKAAAYKHLVVFLRWLSTEACAFHLRRQPEYSEVDVSVLIDWTAQVETGATFHHKACQRIFRPIRKFVSYIDIRFQPATHHLLMLWSPFWGFSVMKWDQNSTLTLQIKNITGRVPRKTP